MVRLAHVFVWEVVQLYRVLASVVLDHDMRFSSRFWWSFQEALGMKVLMSLAYHPQMDGQSK